MCLPSAHPARYEIEDEFSALSPRQPSVPEDFPQTAPTIFRLNFGQARERDTRHQLGLPLDQEPPPTLTLPLSPRVTATPRTQLREVKAEMEFLRWQNQELTRAQEEAQRLAKENEELKTQNEELKRQANQSEELKRLAKENEEQRERLRLLEASNFIGASPRPMLNLSMSSPMKAYHKEPMEEPQGEPGIADAESAPWAADQWKHSDL